MVETTNDEFEKEQQKEQFLFYEKVASYIGRHPEFVEELQKRIEEDEIKNNYSFQEKKSQEQNQEPNKAQSKKGFLNLDEERINTISGELSGLLFNKEGSNKSVLEKTVQDVFSGMVKNYLSKYVD